MSEASAIPAGPDFTLGFPVDRVPEAGMVAGVVNGEAVILTRRGALFHAIGGTCTHYSGSLADGVLDGATIRCPLHHACFDLHTGRVLRGPALTPLPCYAVERRLDRVFVTGPIPAGPETPRPSSANQGALPSRIIIVGAGAAGAAAAFTLRRAGYEGSLVLIGSEPTAPYDRPNISKSYLTGSAPAEWLPLQPPESYERLGIRLVTGTAASRIDPVGRTVFLEDGRAFPYDALLLATGANPVRPPIPGMDRAHLHTIRTLADSNALIASAASARTAVVIGGGFLGLEAAASLRTRGLEVHVVTPDAHPLEAALGHELGARLQRLHESHGVRLQLQHTAREITESSVILDDGTPLLAEVVVVAVGVRPNTALAGRAGLVLNRGIQVDRHLETSQVGIFAAGDAARWPDPRTGELTGCGHWSLAMRMGEAAARNMLGARTAFTAVPFFWSEHYDQRVNCTGNTEGWDRIEVVPGLPADQWEQHYWRDDALVAVATMNRDRTNLEAELDLERRLAASPARPAWRRIPATHEISQ